MTRNSEMTGRLAAAKRRRKSLCATRILELGLDQLPDRQGRLVDLAAKPVARGATIALDIALQNEIHGSHEHRERALQLALELDENFDIAFGLAQKILADAGKRRDEIVVEGSGLALDGMEKPHHRRPVVDDLEA